jgi:hypothetical protein
MSAVFLPSFVGMIPYLIVGLFLMYPSEITELKS